jgi:hypothetical protein
MDILGLGFAEFIASYETIHRLSLTYFLSLIATSFSSWKKKKGVSSFSRIYSNECILTYG